MIPEVFDFRLTSRCNMNCPFCFGTKVNENFNLYKLYDFFSFLRKKGVNYVVITGGEPTLADHFCDIVMLLKSLGYDIALSTNGTFWMDNNSRDFVLNNCSWIALPVESEIEREHNELRSYSMNHFHLIYSILSHIRYDAPNIKIKIGTVVSIKNINHVSNILNIPPIEPDASTPFQKSHTKFNYDYYKENKIKDQDFEKLIQNIKNKYKNVKTSIDYSYEKDRNGRYFFVEPNGDIMVINNNEEQVIGNYCDNGEELMKKIEKLVDARRTNANFHNTFVDDKR